MAAAPDGILDGPVILIIVVVHLHAPGLCILGVLLAGLSTLAPHANLAWLQVWAMLKIICRL